MVLKGMYFPSCLIEIGFLSNGTEAKKLNSAEFQDKLVQGMANAVDAFVASPDLKKYIEE
ncbi:MAG: N-acetylmuramoyl-L-alanine amidase [Candidatus Atribacteria bacterium]|nr:N-acetylmuramoyl-L-alanine amidase [Candidatus Atribacteria bacterium]